METPSSATGSPSAAAIRPPRHNILLDFFNVFLLLLDRFGGGRD
jgi:hypothetical protein